MNKLYKALVCHGEISLSVLECTELVEEAIKIHRLTDGQAKTLGGFLTAAAYMSGCLKSERGAISITVKSGEGGATVSVSGDIAGHIRGYIDGEGLKGGTMTVIKEDGFFRPFTGTCELKSDDVSENLMRYFQMSEQIDTAVLIDVRVEGGKCLAAGGVVMQALPGTSEESLGVAEGKMQALAACDFAAKGADGVMEEFFSDLTEGGGVYLTFPEYKCNCSREKIGRVILSLGWKEAKSILAEQGKISVHCHYCNTDHLFTAEQTEELFGK